MTAREEAIYQKALAYATQKHSSQLRIGGAPYITHPVAVAQLLRENGYGLDYQIAALFHDLLEDTDATNSEIAALSNDAVLNAVLLLTKQKGYDMREYIEKICDNPMAKAVKAADRLHNLQSALVANQEFKRKYILETLDWYMGFSPEISKAVKALAQSLEQPMTEQSFLYEPVKNKLALNSNESEEATVENVFTVARAMQAPSAQALLVLAQDNGILLPLENAQELYASLHGGAGALSDEMLDAVSGGGAIAPKACPRCRMTHVQIVWRGEWLYECLNAQCGVTWGLSE